MSYCFLNLVPEKDGRGFELDGPVGAHVSLLADFPAVGWGIYEVGPGKADEAWIPDAPVSDELAGLIESGKRYPPALGIARNEVVQVFGDNLPSQAEFARVYGTALRTHLSNQHESPYVLARALEDAANLASGEWYWILKISGNPPLASWVSDDFHVYNHLMNAFDLTGQQLKQLGYTE